MGILSWQGSCTWAGWGVAVACTGGRVAGIAEIWEKYYVVEYIKSIRERTWEEKNYDGN